MTSLWCIYSRKQEAGVNLALLKKNQIEQAFRRLGELALLMERLNGRQTGYVNKMEKHTGSL
jgi:hypothetical protein